MYCAILLFNQRRHNVSWSHYLGIKESLEGSKTSARKHPIISGGLRGIMEAPHKYNVHTLSLLANFSCCIMGTCDSCHGSVILCNPPPYVKHMPLCSTWYVLNKAIKNAFIKITAELSTWIRSPSHVSMHNGFSKKGTCFDDFKRTAKVDLP